MKNKIWASVIVVIIALQTVLIGSAYSRNVVVVAIDQKTQDELGPFGPSYRKYHSKILEKLNEYGADGIIFLFGVGENPDAADATKAFAVAAANSKASVVIAKNGHEGADGDWVEEQNAKVFDEYPQIIQGAMAYKRELTSRSGRLDRDGAMLLSPQERGDYWVGLALAIRKGYLKDDSTQLKNLGIVVNVQMVSIGRALMWQQAIRPKIGNLKNITTASYVDLYKGNGNFDASKFKDAWVLVAVTTDDSVQNPDPIGAPNIATLNKTDLAACGLVQVLEAADKAKTSAPTPPAAPAIKPLFLLPPTDLHVISNGVENLPNQ